MGLTPRTSTLYLGCCVTRALKLNQYDSGPGNKVVIGTYAVLTFLIAANRILAPFSIPGRSKLPFMAL